MKLLQLKYDSSSEETLEYLKLRHTSYFATNKLSEPQMLRLIDQLKKKIEASNNPANHSLSKETKAFSLLGKNNSSGTGLSSNGTKQGAGFVSSSFPQISSKNEVPIGSAAAPLSLNFSLKPATKLNGSSPPPAPSASPDFDEYQDERFEEEFEEEIIEEDDDFPGLNWKQTEPPSSGKPGSGNNGGSSSKRKDEEENIYEKVDFNAMKLNKLSDQEVKKVKEQMDIDFNKKIIKPDDNNFVYDKREEFDPQSSNEWDEEILDDF